MDHCLDSWAVLAWFDGDEPAATEVESVLERERPAMSWINLVEVHYRVARDHGADEAENALSELRGHVSENLPGISAMRSVAALKATHPIALADCFAIEAATSQDLSLITGDPEIAERAEQLPCRVVDLR